MVEDPNEKLIKLIEGCIVNDRRSQKELYRSFYSLSMGICLRYAKNREEAATIINEGFFKVFDHINSYDFNRPFVTWLRRIMTNTAIDYYRSTLRFVNQTVELDIVEEHEVLNESTLQMLHYQDLLKMVQSLTPGFRTVFNLYAIEGYSHEEIAALLGISIGTSKSNLYKARAKLAELIRRSERSNAGIHND
ncbi:RNA polymerase sigma factor [Sphingobacterium endophyticum]|uniref:RNA polymerase sigma factor n=1 Tax=Sphingobacterium endophyticum TaxID=2546448 RepID=UPI0018CD8D09|nr:RNA polymerase sigma factor [Sphingobacterium endophyticum]